MLIGSSLIGSSPPALRPRGSMMVSQCSAKAQRGELDGVLEGEAGGALAAPRDDERGDLDQLTITAGMGAGECLRAHDVLLGRARVVARDGHEREEDMLDRVHRTGHAVARGRGLDVMSAAWSWSLTGC
jgi:hypothetical protein